jgi:hypothetical protein
MVKLLILAYDFPPYVSVGGLRPNYWFKHLKQFGIEPIVITRQWSNSHGNYLDYIAPGYSNEVIEENNKNGTIFRTPYKPNLSNRILLKYGENRFNWIRKIISGFYELVQFFLPIGPKSELYHFAKKYLKENKVDVIIATGDPFVLFAYASKLSHEFNTPWIADYRDPWSQSFSFKKGVLQKKIETLIEKRFVQNASQIITVDQLFKVKINSIFPEKSIQVIPNGYDDDEIEKIKHLEQNSDCLSFSYVGTIYKWHPITQLLSDFHSYSIQNPEDKFKLKFYGTNQNEFIINLVSEKFPELLRSLILIDRLPNRELLNQIANDNVLILFNYYQFTGTKIYDYLGVQRLILLCYEDSAYAKELKNKYYFDKIETSTLPQIEILNQTDSGKVIKNSEDLISVIKELQIEFKYSGKIKCNSKDSKDYSRKIQTEKLAKIIHNLKSSSNVVS